jgi:hypothetical protein
MIHAAVFCAEQIIATRFRCLEPLSGVSAGNHICLDAKRRNKKVVDNVLGSHDQLDLASHWNVKFVNLPLAC